MKKILFVCFLALGINSFATTNDVVNKVNLVETTISAEITTIDLIETKDSIEGYYRCRADIYYEGRYVGSVYGYGDSPSSACNNARGNANHAINTDQVATN